MAINPDEPETVALHEEPARRLPFAFAKRHGVLIQDFQDGRAEAIYRRGATPLSLAEARRFAGVPMRFVEVDPESFDLRLQAAYESGAAMTMVEGLDSETDLLAVAQQLPEPSDLLDSDDDAPIIRLINALLTQAVKDNASDIHIEPYENRLVVRFRIDGVLNEVLQSRRAVAPLVVSRIKVMSKLDIAEKRVPQDGRRRARLDDPVRARRARRAATARQAGGPARPVVARHGPRRAKNHGRADPQAARNHPGDGPDRFR